MKKIIFFIALGLLTSCSVKKKVLSQKTETNVSVVRRDTVVVNSELDEIELTVQDTLQPITVTFLSESRPPVTKTFTNVKSVKLSKKISNEFRVIDQKTDMDRTEVQKQRDVEKNNYLWPVLIIAGIWLLSRLKLRKLIGI